MSSEKGVKKGLKYEKCHPDILDSINEVWLSTTPSVGQKQSKIVSLPF